MTILHAEIKCDESAIFEYLDNHIDENEEEPTDLDAEADWFCEDFISTYTFIISDGIPEIKVKVKDEDIIKLEGLIKQLVYLKRHLPNAYEKIKRRACC